jgi:hypothetical protein
MQLLYITKNQSDMIRMTFVGKIFQPKKTLDFFGPNLKMLRSNIAPVSIY